MITFVIVALIAIVIGIIVLAVLGIGGTAVMLVYGDIIICAAIIAWIVVRIVKRKQKQ